MLLLAAATATGAVTGFGLGVVALVTRLTTTSTTVVVVAAVVGVAADVVWRLSGRLSPLSVGRQVPREWSTLFGIRGAALLYGARLGVGPLTVLNTWLWWSAALAAALQGPWASALVGGTFAAVRILVMLVMAACLTPAMAAGMARLRAREGVVAPASAVVVLSACALAALVT